ncbi:TIGR02680 family protein [Streptomyces sp. H10-C2]|uniref:TIGR02680 family protein n=1 Tax=unclassified Streptomyces TaxID=2593676 RepID=UPI0024B9657E|nr:MULTISPECIES: TIGR02680 family protein [unclassified Streptomyces]MDJ0345971.1 TIGR02680 family protein [Streptomyces sp. PH10-H1]MDJ0373862.1 TIGR02680 family protein [Streptomyces sp. H10-C2]
MTRYVPTRAGIVNLWDYRDEEFSFAGGWLILRGPNGSGKTKALEVLFPFVLDGRIDPKRLNPFAAEDRTMKSNLLFRGQDNAVGYTWLELRHRDTGDAVTVGIGLHAQRHRDQPVRWHFVAPGRVGKDFSLLTDDDRPMTKKQLTAEIGPECLHDSASDYRAAIDQRLFGLGRERYEQLLTLILTLRRPQLAKNLDPAKLSDTLSSGLRPVDDDLVAEAARSFDDMEAVQNTLQGLTTADEATASFLSSYTTYLRVHGRWAADALTRRRETSAACAVAVAAAAANLKTAEERQAVAATRLELAENGLAALRARLEQLRSSAAYQALEQLADLERLVRTCAQNADAAAEEHARRAAATSRARRNQESDEALLAELTAAVSRSAAQLADHAAAAGVGWGAADAVAEGLAQRAGARVAERTEAVRAVRAAQAAHRSAEQARDLARLALDRAQAAVGQAEQAEQAAVRAADDTRTRAARELEAWTAQHRELLPEGAAEKLAEALAAIGEPEALAPATVFTAATAPAAERLRDRQAELRAERTRTAAERKQMMAERARIAAEHADAPAAHPARTAARQDRPGAPLWQLVRFADQVTDSQAAGLEAALEAAGLLDAWISPEEQPVAPGDSDAYLRGGPAAPGASLADVLLYEEDTSVPASRVAEVLRSVATDVTDGALTSHPAIVTPDGRYAQGVQYGAHHKPHAEYIGATARARRRAARLADCDARIGRLDARLDELDADATACADGLAALDAARTALPRTAPVTAALADLSRADARLRATREGSDEAHSCYDESVAATGVTERALRRAATEHHLDPDHADAVEAAVHRFAAAAGTLAGQRREEDRQREAAAAAATRLDDAADDEGSAATAERSARRRHSEEAAKLDALQSAVGADAQEVLAQVQAAEAGLDSAGTEAEAARSADRSALTEAATAGARLTAARDAHAVAASEERSTARDLAPYAQRELLDVLKCPPGLGWPGQEADWAESELPAAVTAVHDAILAATRDLTPTENSLKQSTTRLTKALDELQGQLGAAGQDYRPEWDGADGVIVVRITDEQGPLPVGAFAARIASARRDQQQLLTDSEQRILEDALLTRLAQQIHDRTVDARDLISRMNREMRSRRMSSGATIGVSWHLADKLDEEQRAVCTLLDAGANRLGPDALGRMRALFASQIKNARARSRDRPYRELLSEVLDYRDWRQFVFQLVRPDGSEETLTRTRHSRLSGGEQSVSLHLPLFAAAHAMLNSALPHAPRLLALDEAFAGVDDNGRGELLSLAAQFDLDLFMTGYDLWAAHHSVTAAAHYDLAHSPSAHTVSALLLVWDGSQLLADDAGELTAALGSPGARRVPTGTAS